MFESIEGRQPEAWDYEIYTPESDEYRDRAEEIYNEHTMREL